MPLYLAATPDRLARARAVTPRLAHVAYRLGPGRSFWPPASVDPAGRADGAVGLGLSAGWRNRTAWPGRLPGPACGGATPGRRRTLTPPARPDRLGPAGDAFSPAGLLRPTLYVPEHYPVAGQTILLCTALSGGTLEGRLTQAVDQYGAEHLALDLQRLAMDFPLPCHGGQGTP